MSAARRVVIVGAGHGGGTLAILLRQYGYEGPITLIGDESVPPYQRPPLSKAWLTHETTLRELLLKPAEYYAAHAITLKLQTHAETLDVAAQQLQLSDHQREPYDVLVIATGARARRLALLDERIEGALSLRTLDEAERLKGLLQPNTRCVIVGGGYIGLEVAASARARGCEVVVLERESRLLPRVAAPPVAAFLHHHHLQHGVRFEFDVDIAAFEQRAGRIAGVRLADQRLLPCDTLLVGVGAQPNEELAQQAGIACDRGIVVDLEGRTSDPKVFAIGDVTRRPMPHYDCLFRLESVPNAVEQARQVACAITARPAPTPEVPWQWSDQYDLKLQIAGYPFDVSDVLVRGDPAQGKFAVFHLKGSQIQAVEAVNAPSDFVAGRRLIGTRQTIDRHKLVDASMPLKEAVT